MIVAGFWSLVTGHWLLVAGFFSALAAMKSADMMTAFCWNMLVLVIILEANHLKGDIEDDDEDDWNPVYRWTRFQRTSYQKPGTSDQ